MNVHFWKLQGWWGSVPADPSQTSLVSLRLLPAGTGSSGSHPGSVARQISGGIQVAEKKQK